MERNGAALLLNDSLRLASQDGGEARAQIMPPLVPGARTMARPAGRQEGSFT